VRRNRDVTFEEFTVSAAELYRDVQSGTCPVLIEILHFDSDTEFPVVRSCALGLVTRSQWLFWWGLRDKLA
jgi:hypothetical protein